MNQLLGRHWRKKYTEKSTWMQELRAAFGPGPILCPGKRRVTITIHNSREYDQDNAVGACKIVLDAMVTLGFLAGDSSEWLDCSVLQEHSTRKDRHTIITLENIRF